MPVEQDHRKGGVVIRIEFRHWDSQENEGSIGHAEG